MKKSFLLILTTLVLSILSCKQKDPETVRVEKVALQHNVQLFMRGDPVNPFAFPWYDSINMRVSFERLHVAVAAGDLTKDQAEKFKRHKIAWVREDYFGK